MSQELLENPVTAADGMTYERSAIERWLQIRKISPTTGLALTDIDLRHNGQIGGEVAAWCAGKDLHRNTDSDLVSVEFYGRPGTFRLQVAKDLPCKQLYELAFRGFKGHHVKFELFVGNTKLLPTNTPTPLSDDMRVHVNILDTSGTQAFADGDLALVKVYYSCLGKR